MRVFWRLGGTSKEVLSGCWGGFGFNARGLTKFALRVVRVGGLDFRVSGFRV